MSKLIWNQDGKRVYTAGLYKPALFVMKKDGTGYANGVSWGSIITVKENPSGGDESTGYACNEQYYSISSKEKFKGTITAYWSPKEFDACDGSLEADLGGGKLSKGAYATGQKRRRFGLAYVVGLGNDSQDLSYGYELHIIYNAKAEPSERERKTVNDKPDAVTLSWGFSTLPTTVGIADLDATSHVFVRSTEADHDKLKALEEKIFGTDSADAMLPSPKEFFETLAGTAAAAAPGGEAHA